MPNRLLKTTGRWLVNGIIIGLSLALALWLYRQWPQFTYRLIRYQMEFHRELGSLLRASVDLQWSTLLSLLMVSFLYGVFHAAGPGHGKVILSTYLATQPSRLRQAITLSALAALLQALVAIALIGVTGWLLGMSARQAQGWSLWLDRSSFLLVALMGAYLALRAARQLWPLRKPRPTMAIHRLRPQLAREKSELDLLRAATTRHEQADCGCGHAHAPSAEQLASAQSWRSLVGICLSMGLRPCSGALLLLVLARVMEHFWLGAAATLAMAVGTAITVSLLALLSQKARHLALRMAAGKGNQTLTRVSQMMALLGGIVLMAVGGSLMSAPGSLFLLR